MVESSTIKQSFAEALQTCTLIEQFGHELKIQPNSTFKLCMQANMLGTVMLKAGKLSRAEYLLMKAYSLYQEYKEMLPYSHLVYNIGNLYMALKDHRKALEFYELAVHMSPFNNCSEFNSMSDDSN